MVTLREVAEAAAIHAGYSLVILSPRPEQGALERAIEAILERRVDGVMVPRMVLRSGWEELLKRHKHLPIGLIDFPRRAALPGVRFDHAGAIRLLVDHLAGLGHRRVAWVLPGGGGFVEGLRREALGECCAKWSIELHEWREPWDESWQGRVLEDASAALRHWGELATRVALAELASRAASVRPTALLCFNDAVAVGALREVVRRGLRVPQDLSIAGFDNVEAAWSLPSLATVDHRFAEMGRRVCERVIAASQAAAEIKRQAQPPAETVLVAPELIVRESTGPAPA